MCKANDETITHIISECSKLLQKESKGLHDRMGKTMRWDILERKALMFPRNGTNTNLYLIQKMSLFEFS